MIPLARLRSPRFWRATVGPALLTLAVGYGGGFLFAQLGLPAPWMSGALVSTILLVLSPLPADIPDLLRVAGFVVLGCSMGTALSMEMLARAAHWPVSMACLALSVAGVMVGVTWFLKRVGKWNLETAYYASIPGALSTVIAMAVTTRADMRRVAFAQALRLFVLVAALPQLLGVTGTGGSRPPAPPLADSAIPDVLAMLVVSLLGGVLANRLRIPGGFLIGALGGSALLHMGGLSDAHLPDPLLVFSYVVLGAGVGIRFRGTSFATFRESFFTSLGAVLVALVISIAFALLAAWLTGEEAGKLIAAFAPGALETMTVMGFALGFDPAFMSAHHLFRFAGLSVAMPVIAHLLFSARRQAARGDQDADVPP